MPKRGPTSLYCSIRCRRKATKPGRNTDSVCVVCGASMKGYRGRKYCDACRFTGRYVVAGTRRDYPERACVKCGVMFKPRTKEQSHCGRECARLVAGAHVCVECGSTFKHRLSNKQLNKYCSRECGHAARRRIANAHGRKTSAPRAPLGWSHEARARRYGVRVEHVDVMAVFERDRWSCGICGRAVDPLLLWPDPMSASLDHVVPLSRGGAHSMSNTQCAHLLCNTTKNNDIAA